MNSWSSKRPSLVTARAYVLIFQAFQLFSSSVQFCGRSRLPCPCRPESHKRNTCEPASASSPSCFYNAVARLRKKACQIPDPAGKASTLDLTSHKQDVVQIAIEPETSPAELLPHAGNRSMYLDNSHTIEIEAKGLLVRMSNDVQPVLLKLLLDALKEPLC